MARMQPPRIRRVTGSCVREQELQTLLGTAERDTSFEGRRDAALMRVLLDTRTRRAEVAGLRYVPGDGKANDVDLEQGILRVLGKGRRERILPVGRRTVRALDCSCECGRSTVTRPIRAYRSRDAAD